ncbi:MAG: MBL fold metallo-hydrolase, partial [Deltaproteobacteria bacterium]|nr:MBL fold metallo-hydrolase [Deltaproteobacteria bacterium]
MSEAKRGAILEFLGATQTVTGSRFLLSTSRARVLIDCGLYQGQKELRERNWKPLPVDAQSIDSVLLTHAHIDHSGYLPRIVRIGFRGPIFATPRTVELCEIVLPDSGYLQEEEARYASAAGYSKHSPPLPLYTQEDALTCLKQFRSADFEDRVEVADGVWATFRQAGHILGSASITLEVEGAQRAAVTFSGDLGRPSHPFLCPPAPPADAHNIVIESTYGDEEHCESNPEQKLGEAIQRVVDRAGVALIPAFAVDRTEVILFHLKRLVEAGKIPSLPLYVDSPMALASLEVYRNAIRESDQQIRAEFRMNPDILRPDELTEARTTEASKAIRNVRGPAMIVSASGMATGGRVLHHLAQRLPDARNSVIFVGFQAAGTRGRSLIDGRREAK